MAGGGGGFKVENLARTVRDLQTLGVEVEDLKNAFSKIAGEAAERAAGHVNSKSGRLAGSVRGNRAKSKAVVRAGFKSRVPYAGPNNYGWPGRFAGRGFMQKADEEMRPRAIQMLEDEVNNQIRKRRTLR